MQKIYVTLREFIDGKISNLEELLRENLDEVGELIDLDT